MPVIIQVSSPQYRKDNVFFIYLSKRYNNIWRKAREKKVRLFVRIEVPDYVVNEE